MEMWPRVDDKLQLSQMWVSAGRGDRIRPTHKCMKRRTLHMKWGEGHLCWSSSFLSGVSSLSLIGGERDQLWRCSDPFLGGKRHRILCAKLQLMSSWLVLCDFNQCLDYIRTETGKSPNNRDDKTCAWERWQMVLNFCTAEHILGIISNMSWNQGMSFIVQMNIFISWPQWGPAPHLFNLFKDNK